MADVWAEDRQGRVKVDTDDLAWFGRRILRHLGLEEASLSILVTDASGIQRFNREYLKRDRPTNVISFPMQEGESIEGDTSYLGDVVLSVDAAREEAGELGYTRREMLLLYLIHGILHLSGYNHEDVPEAEVRRMEEKQTEILEALSPLLKEHPLTD